MFNSLLSEFMDQEFYPRISISPFEPPAKPAVGTGDHQSGAHRGLRAFTSTAMELYDGQDVSNHQPAGAAASATDALTEKQQFEVTAQESQVMRRTAETQVFLVIRYKVS